MPTRETEIKRASVQAKRLPTRDFKVLRVLVEIKAQWDTAQIRERWQPRSLAQLATECGISKSTLALSLNHLQRHGWLLRYRHLTDKGIGGRGHVTAYQLELGTDCDCPKRVSRTEPVSDAERMRRYRDRIKGSEINVTETAKGSEINVTKGPSVTNDTAGQTPFPAKEGRDEGEVVEDVLKACRICLTAMDPVLPELGYTTHPNCDDEAAVTELLLSKLPAFPESWGSWEAGSNGAAMNPDHVFDRAIQTLADAGMLPESAAA